MCFGSLLQDDVVFSKTLRQLGSGLCVAGTVLIMYSLAFKGFFAAVSNTAYVKFAW